MPNSTSGFTGAEIVTYVKNWAGDQSAEFQTYLELTLPLLEFRYCKITDWKFLNKQNLSLTVASGTNEYALSVANIGFYMAAGDVKSIYNETKGIYLKKTDVETIRRMDPKSDDGTSTSHITHWAPLNDNSILVYPKVFETTELKIDGKISPNALHTLSNYPTIPYRLQDAFIQTVLACALDRQNDDRSAQQKQEAEMLARRDVADNMSSNGSSADEPRMKMWWEAAEDGVGGNLPQAYFDSLFR